MAEESKCTYKELIEILLSAAASMLAEKDIMAEIIPLKDDDVGSLVWLLENIYYGPDSDDTIDSPAEDEGKIIKEATEEYEATVDRPMPEKEKE